jgi:SAM-dependent methyltransferase
MRPNIRDFIEIVSCCLPIVEPIYEFGALQVPGQEGFADMRPFFAHREYVGCDIRQGPGVDMVLDVQKIDLPSEHVGTVVCLDTLEHVEYPHRALEEIHRILKPGGFTVISSVMNFPIHNFPHDYWRFTPQGFASLLKPFAGSFTGFAGDRYFPHTVVGIGFKGQAPDLTEFEARYRQWRKPLDYWAARWVTRLTPPILHPTLSRVYKAAKHGRWASVLKRR